ncbi:RNA polymerase sigma factor RpoD/SigA [Candidatus Pacearchaeota archaeon]|jgi:RNA polymerase primary sigma factor|nr:RNA polymerase sigma factor RpoD/SigA [Candidatus Pacearchaeota archaeon]
MKRSNQDFDSFGIYLKEISQFPILTREQEKELAVRIQKGDLKAKEKLISSNLRFVVKVAKRYRNCGLPLEDLIAEGNCGLIKAIEKYDPSQNVKLISYAVWWIEHTIKDSLSCSNNSIRLPYNKIAKLQNIKTYQDEGFSNNAIAEKMKMKIKDIQYLLNVSGVATSLNTPISNSESPSEIGDSILDLRSYQELESSLLEESLNSIMDKYLTKKEVDVLKMRFGFYDGNSCGLREIGEKYNLTKEGVRQLQNKALGKLRKHDCRLQLESCLENKFY